MVGTSSQSDFSNKEDMYIHGMTLKQAKQLLNSPRSRQVITLASCGGKKVGVVECGDPNGYPVLWFTGLYLIAMFIRNISIYTLINIIVTLLYLL
jgi:hypothetical protein